MTQNSDRVETQKTGEQSDKKWSVIQPQKGLEVLILFMTWVSLKGILLGGKSQSQRPQPLHDSVSSKFGTGKSTETASRLVTAGACEEWWGGTANGCAIAFRDKNILELVVKLVQPCEDTISH